jgi:hypothetical protein
MPTIERSAAVAAYCCLHGSDQTCRRPSTTLSRRVRGAHDVVIADTMRRAARRVVIRTPRSKGPPAMSADSWLSSLILGLDPPTSVTGHTYLSFGRLAFWSPTKSTPLIPIPQRSRPNPLARSTAWGRSTHDDCHRRPSTSSPGLETSRGETCVSLRSMLSDSSKGGGDMATLTWK